MSLSPQLSNAFKALYEGSTVTYTGLKEQLSDVSWEQANTKLYGLNSILALSYHIHYYVRAVINVLEGNKLDASDKYSFDHPEIQSQQEWEKFLEEMWIEVDRFAVLVEQLPESSLWDTFEKEKYGNYYRNIQGIIEHSYYHLGQIVLIKKVLKHKAKDS